MTVRFPVLTDRLFAYDLTAVSKAQAGQPYTGMARDYEGDRSAANRIMDRMARRGGTLTADDRQALAVIVSARTGAPLPEAERRVAAAETEARAAADTARRVAMMVSFWLVAAMFAGALASPLAACEGGAVRDGRGRLFKKEDQMGFGKGALLWMLGIPLPIIILLAIFWR